MDIAKQMQLDQADAKRRKLLKILKWLTIFQIGQAIFLIARLCYSQMTISGMITSIVIFLLNVILLIVVRIQHIKWRRELNSLRSSN